MFNGKALRALRIEAGLTQEELAQRMEELGAYGANSASSIRHLEDGVTMPSGNDLGLLCEIFGVPIFRLVDMPGGVSLPARLLGDVIEGLRDGKTDWALGMIQGALSVMGADIAAPPIPKLSQAEKEADRLASLLGILPPGESVNTFRDDTLYRVTRSEDGESYEWVKLIDAEAGDDAD